MISRTFVLATALAGALLVSAQCAEAATPTGVPGSAVRTTGVPGAATRTTGVPGSALAPPQPVSSAPMITNGAALGHLPEGDLSFLGIDRNGDGKLSKAEFAKAGLSDAQFVTMDRNHDGVISKSEFLSYGPLKRP